MEMLSQFSYNSMILNVEMHKVINGEIYVCNSYLVVTHGMLFALQEDKWVERSDKIIYLCPFEG